MATKPKAKSTKAPEKKMALKDLKAGKNANKVQGGAATFGPEDLRPRQQLN